MKIVITTSSFATYDRSPLDELKKTQIEYTINPYGRKLTSSEVIELAKDADGLVAGTEPLNEEVLRKLPELKVISRCGAGLDNVDLEKAKELNIKVFSTPYGPTLAVAELTLGLMLDLLRGISTEDRLVRSGVWQKNMGSLFSGKTLGIMGLGRIGRRVVELTQPFGLKYIAWDNSPDRQCADKYGIEFDGLDELLAKADIVTIHLPYTPELKGLIGERELGLMKRNAILLNAARGGLMDEAALYNVLKAGRLAGAALDVFEREPYTGPLAELDNVILTPHIGSYAREARVDMETQAAENLLKGLELKGDIGAQ